METLQLRQEGKEQPKTGVFWLLALALLALAAAVYLVLPHFDAYHSQFKYVETVFDQDRVTDVRIIMDEADLADLLANPLEEKMYSATVVINGRKMEHVGVRTKGNSSLRSIANSDSNRYSLKIDFDYYLNP